MYQIVSYIPSFLSTFSQPFLIGFFAVLVVGTAFIFPMLVIKKW